MTLGRIDVQALKKKTPRDGFLGTLRSRYWKFGVRLNKDGKQIRTGILFRVEVVTADDGG